MNHEVLTLIKKIESYFEKCRMDESIHLGLGDIRLTVGMKDEIINILKKVTK